MSKRTNNKSTGANQNLAVALSQDTTGVVDALGLLKKELAGLDAIAETPYKTTGTKVEGFSQTVEDTNDIPTLVKMFSSIDGRANAYDASVGKLATMVGGSFSAPSFKIGGHAPQAYFDDIALKIRVTQIENRRKELTDLVAEAKNFLSEKDKWSLFQKKMSAVASGAKSEDTEYAQIVG